MMERRGGGGGGGGGERERERESWRESIVILLPANLNYERPEPFQQKVDLIDRPN